MRFSEWQPIETAPKDGSRFLTYKRNKRVGDVYAIHKWVGKKFQAVGPSYNPSPTHWMPLPAAPVI